MITPNFALLSASPKVKFNELGPVAAAVMRQINDHFFRFWGQRGTVTPFATQDQVPLSYWRITIVEERPSGFMGVHRSQNNQPYAYVSDEDNWTVAVSHEVLEMLVDPTLSVFRAGTLGNPPRRVNFLVEVCDPCQAVAYPVDGVAVSDFVTPSYFDPQAAAGAQYSFCGEIQRPYSVAPNGYLVWHDPADNQYYAYTSDGTNGETIQLGASPQGAGTTPREWVDSILRKDGIPLSKGTLLSLEVAHNANREAVKSHAKPWIKELHAMKRAKRHACALAGNTSDTGAA